MEDRREKLTLLAINSLAKRYGSDWIFQDVQCVMSKGQSVRIAGPNGSGKSTLMRIVAGLSPADQGAVECSCSVAYAGHTMDLYDGWTARQNLEHFLGLQRLESIQSVVDAVNKIGLAPHIEKPVSVLSQGNKQRVSLLLVLCSSAGLWVLDEPLNALDAQSVRFVREQVAAHLEHGGCVLWSGHSQELQSDHQLNLGAEL
jgi:heme exporter protein A